MNTYYFVIPTTSTVFELIKSAYPGLEVYSYNINSPSGVYFGTFTTISEVIRLMEICKLEFYKL